MSSVSASVYIMVIDRENHFIIKIMYRKRRDLEV